MENKTAVITGASGGIGGAIAKRLAKDGFNVVINYSNSKSRAESIKNDIESMGGTAEIFKADVSKPQDAASLIEFAKEKFGSVDVLVNNAGITRDKLLMQMKDEDINDVLDINLKSAFNCSRAVIRIMMKQRHGRIINMSSVVGIAGEAGQTNYAASKAGLIGMTKALAKEVASRGITVNAIAPGYITTNMTDVLPDKIKQNIIESIPLGRPGTPEDIAAAAAFLAGEDACYITGQVLNVSGGLLI